MDYAIEYLALLQQMQADTEAKPGLAYAELIDFDESGQHENVARTLQTLQTEG